jgi:hypothetical protein
MHNLKLRQLKRLQLVKNVIIFEQMKAKLTGQVLVQLQTLFKQRSASSADGVSIQLTGANHSIQLVSISKT